MGLHDKPAHSCYLQTLTCCIARASQRRTPKGHHPCTSQREDQSPLCTPSFVSTSPPQTMVPCIPKGLFCYAASHSPATSMDLYLWQNDHCHLSKAAANQPAIDLLKLSISSLQLCPFSQVLLLGTVRPISRFQLQAKIKIGYPPLGRARWVANRLDKPTGRSKRSGIYTVCRFWHAT
jgi:hypothetical protein